MSPRPWTAIQSSIAHSEKLYSVDNAAALFYVLLLTQVDSFGRIDAGPVGLFARVFAGRPGETPATVTAHADALVEAGLLERYEVDGKPYLLVPDWEAKAGSSMRAKDRRQAECPAPGVDDWDPARELADWKTALEAQEAASSLPQDAPGIPREAPGVPRENPGTPREVPGTPVARTGTGTGTGTTRGVDTRASAPEAPPAPAPPDRAPLSEGDPAEPADRPPADWLVEALGLIHPGSGAVSGAWRAWLEHLDQTGKPPARTTLERHAAAVSAAAAVGAGVASGMLEDAIAAGVRVIRQDDVRRAIDRHGTGSGSRPDPTGSDRARAEIDAASRANIERVASDLRNVTREPARDWPAYRAWISLIGDRPGVAPDVAEAVGVDGRQLAAAAVASWREAEIPDDERAMFGPSIELIERALESPSKLRRVS